MTHPAIAHRDLSKYVLDNIHSYIRGGNALALIKERKLYKRTHPRWETYLMEEYGYTTKQANKLMAAAATAIEANEKHNIMLNYRAAITLANVSAEVRHATLAQAFRDAPTVRGKKRVTWNVIRRAYTKLYDGVLSEAS